MAPLSPELRALLDGPSIVHLATLMPDGSPASVAVWAALRGEHIVFFTQPTSRKARNVAADPRVALSVVDRDNPYRTGRVRGRVVETIEGADALRIIDRISHLYTGAPFPMRSGNVYVVEHEHESFMELPFRDEPGGA